MAFDAFCVMWEIRARSEQRCKLLKDYLDDLKSSDTDRTDEVARTEILYERALTTFRRSDGILKVLEMKCPLAYAEWKAKINNE